MSTYDALEDMSDALENSTDAARQTAQAAAVMAGEMDTLKQKMTWSSAEVSGFSSSFSGSLKSAFDGVVFGSKSASEALRSLAQSMITDVYNAAMKPVTGAVGGALAKGMNSLVSAILPFAKGASFSQGRVMPFAKGGVVSSPMAFPMRGAIGLMGEAGPEAIMPLSRGPDGSLGVRAQGGGSVNVVMNISTPDVQGFRKSQTQIAAEMQRMMARGQRNK